MKDEESEFYCISLNQIIGIKKIKERIIITEFSQLSEEFIEELKSGNVTSSIIGIG